MPFSPVAGTVGSGSVAARPALPDVFRLGRAIKRGSAIERPISLAGVVREFLSGDTPNDSPLTLKALMSREDYRDLSTPKLVEGDPAFDFELPRYDFSDGSAIATGATVRLSEFRSVQPVALIFGSYT
jgi:hypothetical protein